MVSANQRTISNVQKATLKSLDRARIGVLAQGKISQTLNQASGSVHKNEPSYRVRGKTFLGKKGKKGLEDSAEPQKPLVIGGKKCESRDRGEKGDSAPAPSARSSTTSTSSTSVDERLDSSKPKSSCTKSTNPVLRFEESYEYELFKEMRLRGTKQVSPIGAVA
eukprot:gnl/TRDRNA2_/TRDRNA2_100657_c1_seq1.p1 gnl/TRDRNA2_/TRDRNA2_100657_c1~~gnl/TRDRNA2_/TRDRNA2_100657_c1_seq1.p1  ORF type:complete len:164 (+),score=23.55 gnl/TRDRNA2_/TRDRNA2_100657_c1_seq1:97-588(+)